jgi:hypothetical protein
VLAYDMIPPLDRADDNPRHPVNPQEWMASEGTVAPYILTNWADLLGILSRFAMMTA